MKSALLTTLLFSSTLALAQQAPAKQDLGLLRQAVEQYLQTQSAGLPGQVTITVGNIDQRMNLAACVAPQAFQQPGARPWGKTTVGVRCSAPTPWTVYIQAQVSVLGKYVAAAVPLVNGQAIEATQLTMVSGDLAALPNGVVTDMAQAIGRTSSMSLAAGSPLRLDALRSKPVVQQGQAVRVVTKGAGFSVSAEAKAIGNASTASITVTDTATRIVRTTTAR